MTKLSYQVTLSVLAAVLALTLGLCLLLIPKSAAKATTALTGVPFTVSGGTLNTTGGEGLISTQTFTNNGFTLTVRLTVTNGAAELYLGENLEYYLRVSPLGTAPGVSITQKDKRLTVYYNTFTGCNYALGDVIDLKLTYAGGKLAFAMKKAADSSYTNLAAKVNDEQKNVIFSNNAPGQLPKYTYTTITDWTCTLNKTRIGIGTERDLAFSVQSLSMTGNGFTPLNEDFASLDASVWHSNQAPYTTKTGEFVMPFSSELELTTKKETIKNSSAISLRMKVDAGTATLSFGDNRFTVNPAEGKFGNYDTDIAYGEFFTVLVYHRNNYLEISVNSELIAVHAFSGTNYKFTVALNGVSSQAAIDFFRAFGNNAGNNSGIIVADDFSYFNYENWSGYGKADYDLAKMVQPVWEGNTAYEEGVWLVGNADGSKAQTVALLHKISTIVEIKKADNSVVYTPGVDYSISAGKLVIPETTRMPVMSKATYDNGAFLYNNVGYHADNTWEVNQIKVTYTYTQKTDLSTPPLQTSNLPKTTSILQNGGDLKIVTFGDSITEGCSASGHFDVSPFMDSWAFMMEDALNAMYPNVNVSVQNSGFGGTGASYAMGGHGAFESSGNYASMRDYVVPYDPDLVILAFGMNDSGTSANYYKVAFYDYVISGLKTLVPNAEILVLSPMTSNVYQSSMGCLIGMADVFATYKGDGVAFCDITALHLSMMGLNRKKLDTPVENGHREYDLIQDTSRQFYKDYRDTSGNNYNHPNDYFARVYAQAVMRCFTDKTLALSNTISQTGSTGYAYYKVGSSVERGTSLMKNNFSILQVDSLGGLTVLDAVSSISYNWADAENSNNLAVTVSSRGGTTFVVHIPITEKPSATPSTQPTVTPTTQPSVTPTTQPTVTPTTQPSVTPTTQPSVTPTTQPSVTPTTQPSVTPTLQPTVTPTMQPTVTPTVQPTVTPTMQPTVTPTVQPSVEPSVVPSTEPSVEPSTEPSVEPSVMKTNGCKKATAKTLAFLASVMALAGVMLFGKKR